jgi:HD superfamily phosphohydrolase
MIKIGEVKIFLDFDKFENINYYIIESENNFGIRVENETTNEVMEINNVANNEIDVFKLVKQIIASYIDFDQIRYLIEDNIA